MKKGWLPICGGTPWMDSIGEQLLIGTLSEKQFTLSAQWITSRKTMSVAITVDDDDEQVTYRRLVITFRIHIFVWVNAGRHSSYWDLRILRRPHQVLHRWTYCVWWERIHILRQNSFTWVTWLCQKTMVTARYPSGRLSQGIELIVAIDHAYYPSNLRAARVRLHDESQIVFFSRNLFDDRLRGS